MTLNPVPFGFCGWQKKVDEWDRPFYVNHLDQITQWNPPDGVHFDSNGFQIGTSAFPSYPNTNGLCNSPSANEDTNITFSSSGIPLFKDQPSSYRSTNLSFGNIQYSFTTNSDYGTLTPSVPPVVLSSHRNSTDKSIQTDPDRQRCCSTLTHTYCSSLTPCFFYGICAVLVFVVAPSIESKADLDRYYEVLAPVLFVLFFILVLYILLCHMVLCPNACCCGRKYRDGVRKYENLLGDGLVVYGPLHYIRDAPTTLSSTSPLIGDDHTTPSERLINIISDLDNAVPHLYIRVGGYVSEAAFKRAQSRHGGNQSSSDVPYSVEPGFTHYLPVAIESVTNSSCDGAQLEEWIHSRKSYTTVHVEYTYCLSEQDELHVATLLKEVKELYTGVLSCNYIHTELVYVLDPIIPSGEMMESTEYDVSGPYDARFLGKYNKYKRPGVNSRLFYWKDAPAGGSHGESGVLEIIKPKYNCLKEFYLSWGCLALFFVCCCYTPYVWLYRHLIVDEKVFVHTKTLKLASK